MEVVNFTPIPALIGGLLIGSAAALVLYLGGHIAGISGIVARLFTAAPAGRVWRALFLVGMLAGGALTFLLWPPSAAHGSQAGGWTIALAGFLVGLGTRLGGGCTSGHGVCGMTRGSLRSLVATLVFMGAGFATVYFLRHVLGGPNA
jgi:uncharacterized protein